MRSKRANPSHSAFYGSKRGESLPLRLVPPVYCAATVLGGELAVPCTRNPLQRDRIPTGGAGLWGLTSVRSVDGQVSRNGNL